MAVKIFKKASLRPSPWCCTSVYFVRSFLSARKFFASWNIFCLFYYLPCFLNRIFFKTNFVKVNCRRNSSLGKDPIDFRGTGSANWFWNEFILKVARFVISRLLGNFNVPALFRSSQGWRQRWSWSRRTFPPPLFHRLLIEFNWKESGFWNFVVNVGNDRIVCIKELLYAIYGLLKIFSNSIRCKIFSFVFISILVPVLIKCFK